MHDPDFRQAERDWHSFVAKLTEKLIEIDDTIPELPVKDVVSLAPTSRKDALVFADDLDSAKIFRIYRDVRFTSDPTPYKVSYGSHPKRPRAETIKSLMHELAATFLSCMVRRFCPNFNMGPRYAKRCTGREPGER